MTRRRRVWSELLPARELGSSATIELLKSFDLEPIVALPPSAESTDMATALARLTDAGLRLGIWPLLDDADGYWPSMENAHLFRDRVDDALRFVEASGARAQTVAVDLEPPLEMTRRLVDGPRVPALYEETRAALSARGRELRARSSHVFESLRRDLAKRDLETLAAVLPFVAFDLSAGSSISQGLFGTPVASADWDVVCPMLYTSMIAELLPSGSLGGARSLLYETMRFLTEGQPPERCSASLGLLAIGKLGNEAVLPHPEELRLDVSAARAAGVDDLALFSLEGVLHHGEPEPWLRAFTTAEAEVPRGSLPATAVSSLARGLAMALRPWTGPSK